MIFLKLYLDLMLGIESKMLIKVNFNNIAESAANKNVLLVEDKLAEQQNLMIYPNTAKD